MELCTVMGWHTSRVSPALCPDSPQPWTMDWDIPCPGNCQLTAKNNNNEKSMSQLQNFIFKIKFTIHFEESITMCLLTALFTGSVAQLGDKHLLFSIWDFTPLSHLSSALSNNLVSREPHLSAAAACQLQERRREPCWWDVWSALSSHDEWGSVKKESAVL